jgi:HNH endonuclease
MGQNRPPNTTRPGERFDEATIERVWQKGTPVPGYPSNMRKDKCGAWMDRSRYGDRSSSFGWEIDHKQPVAAGGSDDPSNLQPLQWQNNAHKADNWPDWTCKITP